MEKKIKRERVIKTVGEVNKLIKLIDKYGLKVIKIGRGGDYRTINEFMAMTRQKPSLNRHLIIELKDTKLLISTMYLDFKPCTYHFNLNQEEIFSISGLSCFSQFCRCFKMPKASSYHEPKLDVWFNEEKGSYACSASPTIGFNRKFQEMELVDVYEYDKNSAYSSVLMEKVPNLHCPLFKKNQKVRKGYVGFYIDDTLTLVEEGGYADVTFPLIDAPESLKQYCLRWYNKKQQSKGTEKLEAKAMLNLPIGYCQRFNPFLRSYVVHKCNMSITKLIDKDTLCWNTDAIFSKKKRTDLSIGVEIGQFKEKHFKTFRYIGNSYQMDDELPTYRGVPKAWFKRFEVENGRPFNLLKDELPQDKNMYSWNWETLRLEKNYD